jgi:hypothetical protein
MSDYFDSEEAQAPTATAEPQGNEGGEQHDDEQEKDQSALLPKSFFPTDDLKPGYRCEIEVEAVHSEEVSCRWLGSAEEDEEGSINEAPPPTPGSMGSMME